MGHREHREAGASPLRVAVLTVSDTRTEQTDESGRLIRTLLEGAGHAVTASRIVPDDPAQVRDAIEGLLAGSEAQAILVNGGTGVSSRDRTHEAIGALLDRRLDGFGELFRFLSYREIGPAAMLSRAVAGVARGRPIFSMPGSPAAVRLAMEELILPELGHVVSEATRST